VQAVRAFLPLLLLLAASLAGCSDGGGGDDDPGMGGTGGAAGHGAHGGSDSATHLLAPTWEVGQWWTWTSEQAAAPFTYVVSKDAGQDWILDTDSPDIAFFNAQSDISLLGQVRKADLAGSQGTQRVEFFQFPLTAQKNWTATWDGLPVTIQVDSVANGVAELSATHENGTPYASYSYDAKTGYFRDTTFYAADGVTVAFAATVTASGKAFSGDLVRWTLETLFEKHGTWAPSTATSNVGPGYTDVWLSVAISCTTGAFTLNFGPLTGPAEERGLSANGPCPQEFADSYVVSAPTQAELWGYQEAAAPTTDGTRDVLALLRTQATFKAGEAP
jgi:hypothetical protein